MGEQTTVVSNFSELLDDIFYIEHLYSENAKLLASEISNETARKILRELYRSPASITDLSNKLNIPVSTVQYHVNKLTDLGLIKIAHKKVGKRMRDVKMYVYDKECIIFLSSMKKRDFADLVRKFALRFIERSLQAFLMIFALSGLFSAFAGSLIIKRLIEDRIGNLDRMATASGGVDLSFVLVVTFGMYLVGVIFSVAAFWLLIRKRFDSKFEF